MFPFNNHHEGRRASTGRRARLGRGRSRRLRVEAMESRLMLAGTTVDFAPLDLEAAEIRLSDLRSYLLDQKQDQVVYVGTLTEGGFVTDQANYFGAIADDFDHVVAFDRDIVSSPSSNSLVTLGTTRTTGTFINADSSSSWTQFDVTGVLGDGMTLQVIAVPPSPVSSTAALELKPILSEFAANRSPVSEGGLIPIQPILGAPVGGSPGIGTVAKVRSPETPLEETPSNSFAAASKASTTATVSSTAIAVAGDRAIYGEWARAMVFETAGGEPDQNPQAGVGNTGALRPLSTGAVNLPTDQPLSSNRAIHATGERGAGDGKAVARLGGVQLSVDLWDEPSDGLVAGFGVLPTSWAAVDGDAAAESSSTSRTANVANGPAGAFVGPDLARAAAFDEIGGGELQSFQSFTHGVARGSLGATPLLMVLALERIAASNSRRAKREGGAIGLRSHWRLPAWGGQTDEV